MKKQLILILGALCITVSLLGCGGSNTNTMNSNEDTLVVNQEEEVEEDKADNPEEYIENMYKALINKDITFQDMWDDYFSDTTKNSGIIDRKTYIENKETNDFKNNIVRTDIKVVSSEQMKDNIYKVKSILKYTVNGEEKSEDLVDYVIKENNNLRYLSDGVLDVNELGNSVIENINYNNVKKINYVEGLGIIMNIENKYDNPIALGWVNGPTIILKTDKGEYTSTLNPIRIDRGQTQNIEIKFEDVQGEIESITINNINYLDNRGLPTDHTGGTSHTLQL